MGDSEGGVQQQRPSQNQESDSPSKTNGGLKKALTQLDYKSWESAMLSVAVEQKELQIRQLSVNLLDKDRHITILNMALMRAKVDMQSNKVEKTKKEFELLKKKIESELGLSLSNCTINPVTLEVTPLPEEKKPSDVKGD